MKLRSIKTITLHCSDSDRIEDDNIETIRLWHTLPPPKGKGWSDVGYHYFILKSGKIEKGRPVAQIPASAKDHNKDTLAICLSGKTQFTQEQFNSCALLCQITMEKNHIPIESIYPHSHFNPNKTCPNFDINLVKKLISLI